MTMFNPRGWPRLPDWLDPHERRRSPRRSTEKRSTRLCCTDRLVNALSPPPACGLGDADGLRASKLEHAVQDFDGDGRLGSAALIRP